MTEPEQTLTPATLRLSRVNRRRTLTPNRRPRLTRFLGRVQRVALAPAELVRVAQPGRARMV
jgi:hypothetical protein